ncbi:RluA family pseudouridine synthase [Anaerolineae bacterium CFX9]|jgi:23S rRNA pseudouridine1911/1915/1917 synthase|nr:RluA family pseudouridine synthase [Anaerolineae bacterium CFX9]
MNAIPEEIIEFNAHLPGERLDKTIVAHVGERLSRAQIQALIEDGSVTINDAPAKPGWRLKGGEVIRMVLPPAEARQEALAAEAIPLDVLYSDEHIAVINKPAGLVVHPGSGNPGGTLVNALMARFPEIGEMDYAPQRRGIVHRLDKDTSGVIVVARNAIALRRLLRQFQDRSVEKVYLALLERPPRTDTGRIDVPIERDPVNRRKMRVDRAGRHAISEFYVTERFNDGLTLVRVNLLTGRTHQIRVHMAFIGCPIVGDALYGFRRQRLPLRRQFLHAWRLCIDHPATGERLCFEAPLAPELQRILDTLRREAGAGGDTSI